VLPPIIVSLILISSGTIAIYATTKRKIEVRRKNCEKEKKKDSNTIILKDILYYFLILRDKIDTTFIER